MTGPTDDLIKKLAKRVNESDKNQRISLAIVNKDLSARLGNVERALKVLIEMLKDQRPDLVKKASERYKSSKLTEAKKLKALANSLTMNDR